MKTEPDKINEVDKLVDLLHHKSPPQPCDVAHQVINQIKRPRPSGPLTWWQRLGLDFDKQPVLVCASGVAVCGLLIYGVITSLRVKPPAPGPSLFLPDASVEPSPDGLALSGNAGLPPTPKPGPVPPSTAPVLSPNKTPFSHEPERKAAEGGYNTGVGGN